MHGFCIYKGKYILTKRSIFMKKISVLFIVFMPFMAFGQPGASQVCDKENYQEFIYKFGIHNCDLSGTNFVGADLFRTNLSGANLTNADLGEADLFGVDFTGANLSEANLVGADILEADFTGANLTNTKVDPEQAEYLTAKGISGFVIVEESEVLFQEEGP